jgi:hypothetical protein
VEGEGEGGRPTPPPRRQAPVSPPLWGFSPIPIHHHRESEEWRKGRLEVAAPRCCTTTSGLPSSPSCAAAGAVRRTPPWECRPVKPTHRRQSCCVEGTVVKPRTAPPRSRTSQGPRRRPYSASYSALPPPSSSPSPPSCCRVQKRKVNPRPPSPCCGPSLRAVDDRALCARVLPGRLLPAPRCRADPLSLECWPLSHAGRLAGAAAYCDARAPCFASCRPCSDECTPSPGLPSAPTR